MQCCWWINLHLESLNFSPKRSALRSKLRAAAVAPLRWTHLTASRWNQGDILLNTEFSRILPIWSSFGLTGKGSITRWHYLLKTSCLLQLLKQTVKGFQHLRRFIQRLHENEFQRYVKIWQIRILEKTECCVCEPFLNHGANWRTYNITNTNNVCIFECYSYDST